MREKHTRMLQSSKKNASEKQCHGDSYVIGMHLTRVDIVSDRCSSRSVALKRLLLSAAAVTEIHP
jgi:hypothetical protein